MHDAGQAVIPEERSAGHPVVAIVDPAVRRLVGHPLLQAVSLGTAFRQNGYDCFLLAHRDLPEHDLLSGLNVHRHFSVFSSANRASDIHAISPVLTEEMKSAIRQMAGRRCHFVFPSVHIVVFAALCALIKSETELLRSRDFLFSVLLYFECGVRLDRERGLVEYDSALADSWRKAFDEWHQHGAETLHLFAVSSEMAQIYSHVAGRPIASIPPFHSIRASGERHLVPRAPDAKPRVLLYPGAAARGKNFGRLAKLAAKIVDELPNVEFVVQLHGLRTEEDRAVAAEIRRLAVSCGNLEIIDGFLSDVKLEQLFQSCDIIFLGYRPATYAGKTSGFLWDAIAAGRTVVTSGNTWLARECSNYGAPAVLYRGRSLAAARKAISVAVEKLGKFRPTAMAAAQRFLAETGPQILIRHHLPRFSEDVIDLMGPLRP